MGVFQVSVLMPTVAESIWEHKAGKTEGNVVKEVDNVVSDTSARQSKANLAIITLK